MPNWGKLDECDWIEVWLQSSGSGSPHFSHSASGNTDWAENPLVRASDVGDPIIQLAVGSSTAGTWSAYYNGPDAPFGGYTVSGGVFLGTVKIAARFLNAKVYAELTGALLNLSFTGIEIYVNGTLSTTLGPGVSAVSNGVGPNYILFLGEPFKFTGSCSSSYDAPVTDEYDVTADGSAVATGGWRFKEIGGAIQDLPMTVPGGSFQCSGASTSAGAIGSYSHSEAHRHLYATQTASNHVVYYCAGVPVSSWDGPSYCILTEGGFGQAKRKVYKHDTASRSASGSLMAQPDLAKSIHRMAPGYAAIWYRGAFPEVRSLASHSDTENGVTSSSNTTTTTHPAESVFLACVGDSSHVIEAPFGYNSFTPTTSSKNDNSSTTYEIVNLYSACQCPPPGAPSLASITCDDPATAICTLVWGDLPANTSSLISDSFTFPSYVQDRDTNAALGDYTYHAEPVSRYLSSWCNPHWKYWHWFPPNDTGDASGTQNQWPLSGGAVSNVYWKQIRSQWLYQSALPSIEQRKTRSDFISSCVDESGHTLYQDAFFGQNLRWLGVSRFKVDPCNLQSSYPLKASCAASWTYSGCTATQDGVGIHLTRVGGATSYTCTLDLGSFFIQPFQFGHLWTSVLLGFGTNVASISASVVGVDGTSVVIGAAAGTFPFPTGGASQFAGSWAVDNGDGYASDTGVDVGGSGISAALMADPEGVFAFQLLPGRTAAKLVITVVPTDPASPCILNYPVFYGPPKHPVIVWESGQCASLLYENGPGVRWGNWQWYIPGLGFQQPAALAVLGSKSTIIDAISFRRVVFEGVDPQTGGTSLDGSVTIPSLTTELASRYDTLEGQSVPVVDKFSIAFPLPKGADETLRFAHVNTMAELPPISCFPFRARDTGTWLASSVYDLSVWDWAQETRYLAMPSTGPAKIETPSGAVVGASVMAPPGWALWGFSPQVDNTESGWGIYDDGHKIASVTPWHGYFLIYAASHAQFIHLCPSRTGQLYAALGTTDRLKAWRFDLAQPSPDEFTVDANAYDSGQIAISPTGSLFIAADRSSTVYFFRSTSSAQFWSTAVSIAAGTNPAPAIDPTTSIEYVALHNGTEWRCYRQDSTSLDTFHDVGQICTLATGKAGLEFRGAALRELVFCVFDSGTNTIRRFISTSSGQHFDEA